MEFDLTPELEELIRRKVESGLCGDRTEVVRDTLRLLAEQDRRHGTHVEGLRPSLAEGWTQAGRGELRDGAEALADIRSMLQRRRKGSA